MSKHKDAAKSVLIRLYQRISNPTAKDAKIRDIGLKALDQLEPDEPPFDYDSLNANQAREAVEQGLITREAAILKEKAGKQRKALLAWLEGGE